MNHAKIKKAVKKYKAFHGTRPNKLTSKTIKNFDTLVYLADPEFITYKSKKFNGGGDGTLNFFKHKFSKSTKLYCTLDGKNLIIMGANIKVTPAGIRG